MAHTTPSGLNCLVCTFENHVSATQCGICGAPFEEIPVTYHFDEDSLLQKALADMAIEDDAHAAAIRAATEFADMSLPERKDYVNCPYCSLAIQIVEVNCTIFMCGTTIATQLPQHNEAYAAAAVAAGEVRLGCGKQFRLIADKPVPCAGL